MASIHCFNQLIFFKYKRKNKNNNFCIKGNVM